MKLYKPLLFINAAILVLLLLGARPVSAVIYRHDVDPAEFLLPDDAFPAVFNIFERGGAGTLITPVWAITAAHVAQSIPTDGSHSISIGGNPYTVDKVILHPEWEQIHINDIALIHFSKAVSGVEPIDLYLDGDEVGQTAIIVGRGDFGDGQSGDTTLMDGHIRAVTNIVEKIESGSIWFHFDEPGASNATAREGVAGPGDSGGPALLEDENGYRIIGVASFGLGLGESPPPPGTYGTWDTFTNISYFQSWIDETMAQTEETTGVSNENSAPDPVVETPNLPPLTAENQAAESGNNLIPITIGVILLALLIGVGIIYNKSQSGPYSGYGSFCATLDVLWSKIRLK